MASASEGWAVGGDILTGGIILHYTGGQWTTFTTLSNVVLDDVAMVSASDGWAVGYDIASSSGSGIGQGAGVILHYTGGQWTTVTVPDSPKPSNNVSATANNRPLSSVAMVSATEGWAVGVGTILHYSAGRWEAERSPTPDNLADVSMVSSTEGWAVGVGGEILHFVATQ
jgi:hypothetical protein